MPYRGRIALYPHPEIARTWAIDVTMVWQTPDEWLDEALELGMFRTAIFDPKRTT